MTAVDEILTPDVRAAITAPIERARTLPRQAFASPEFAEAESEQIFAANWCALHFIELIENPGDIVPIELAGMPLVIVRDLVGVLRVFHNIVPYDGCLAVIDEVKEASEIRTPYHGWWYSLDGKLIATPYWDGTIDGSNIGELGDRPGDLKEVSSAVWGPILFVNVDGRAGSFDDAVQSLHRALDGWDVDGMRIAREEDGAPLLDPEDLKTNWKTHLENWGINVLHEAFVHEQYDRSPEVPRMDPDGRITFEHYVDDRLMALKYREADFPMTYGEMPFPLLAMDSASPTEVGYFGTFMPNLHFGVFAGLIHFIVSLPEGPSRTRTTRAQFYEKHAAGDAAYLELRRMLAAGFAAAGEEDARITEAVQRARSSPAFESQYYSKRWDQMHYRFSQWVLNQMS